MYSDSFFMLLKDSKQNILTRRSDVEVEHAIYTELKSKEFESLWKSYIEEGLDFPDVVISNCPIISKNLGLLTKNNAITFSAKDQTLKVCKNYIMCP